ncbi:thermonuclease family protein [Aquipseudomonas alcaligenes]|uniref:thermonuclease family protein n=1 Tax=Aquipseudomonas alcaligenes TaxID=43263 RepID=UPI00374A8351
MRAWLAAALLSTAPVLHAEVHTCRVVALSDGDTFTCLDVYKSQHKIRLANIDTPEKDQPYGAKSKQVLSALIFAKQVKVESQGTDRYGRTIGVVSVSGVNVNREMVARGAAWVYPQYNQDHSLPRVEQEAQATKRGVWGLPQAQIIAPWEWRKLGRSLNSEFTARKQQSALTPATAAGGGCSKRLCGQMNNCADALFHLQQCGVTSLDRDGDGVPCESLCR